MTPIAIFLFLTGLCFFVAGFDSPKKPSPIVFPPRPQTPLVRRIKDTLTILVLLLTCGILSGIAYEMYHLRPRLESASRALAATLRETDLTLKNLREASATWEQASKDQSFQTSQVLLRVNAVASQLSTFVKSTDKSLNATLLPAATSAINQQSAALLKSQELLSGNFKDLSETTQQLQMVLVDADKVISDPAIKESLDRLATASQNAAEATSHLSNITASGERTAAYYEKKLTTPAGFLKTLVQAILQLGSQARILVGK